MTRQPSRRVHLRTVVALISVVASACAGASGVRPDDRGGPPLVTTTAEAGDPATTTTTEPSVYGGTVVVGFADGGSPRSLNPLLDSPDAAALDLILPAVFAQAFDTDPETGAAIPDAVAAVPSLEEGTIVDQGDGTKIVTLEVVDGAQWADGTSITADDLVFTYRLAIDPDLPIRSDVADRYGAIVPGSPTADGRTFSFRMAADADPTQLFEVIVPSHQVDGTDFADDWDDEMWVAGGPYVVADWQPGQFIELERNPQYWKVTAAEGAPLPFLDRVIVRFYEPGPALDPRLVEAFGRAELAVVAFDRAADRAEELAAAASDAEVTTTPSGSWEHLNFQFGPANRNTGSLNASLAYRRAVLYAIDRATLADGRGTVVAQSILQRFDPSFASVPFTPYEFDLDQTSTLLAGVNPPVILTVPGDDPASLALGGDMVTMLRDAGFEAELQLEDADLFFGATLDNGSWDLGAWRFGPGHGLSAAIDFMRFYDPDGLPFVGDNYFRWGTVDSLVDNEATRRFRDIIDALERTVDPAAVRPLLEEAELILADQAVLLPLFLTNEVGLGVWPDLVEGVRINAVQGPLWNVDTWRVPTG